MLGVPPDAPVDNVDPAAADGTDGATRKRDRTLTVADVRRRRAARAARRAGRAASRPTAGSVQPGRRVRRLSRRAARRPRVTSPTRSRAAPAAVLWERAGLRTGIATWTLPHLPRRRPEGASSASIADVVYGHPSRDAVDGRRHRHQRQDLVRALDRAGARRAAAGAPRCSARWATASSARSQPATQHDARRRACCTRLLAQFRAAGARAVAMEVSSHGLDQGRVNGVAFDVALFTNLTRDHLDYHGTMAAYGAAKAQLFAWPGLRVGVINVDDAFGQRLDRRARARAGSKVLTYGFGARRHRGDAASRSTRAASRSSVDTPWGTGDVAHARWSARSTRRTCSACSACCSSSGVALRRGARACSPTSSRRPAACSGSAAATGRWSSSTTRTRPTRSRRC